MTILPSFILLVAVTIAVVEILKRAFSLDTKICPLLSVVVGFVLTWITKGTGIGTLVGDFSVIFQGIVIGVSASGTFSWKKYLGK